MIALSLRWTVARAAPLFYLDVRPDTTPMGWLAVNREGGKVTAVGWPAKRLLGLLLQMPEDRIADGGLLPGGRYTVVADMPPGRADELEMEIERALGLAWGVRVHHEERKMDVYLLTAPHGVPAGLRPVAAPGRSAGTKGPSMAALARMLEDSLDRPVLDETHLEGAYDYRLNLTAGDAAGAARWPTTSGQRTQQRQEPPGEHGSVGGYAGGANHGTLPVSIVACPVRDDVLQYGVPLAGVCALTAGQPFHLPDAAVPYPRRCNGLRMTQPEYRFPLGCPLIGELAQLCQSFVIRTQVTFAFLPAKLSCPHALDVDVLDRVAVVGVGLSALLIPPRGLCPPPPVRSAAAPAR